jgi:hypothetical protein
LICLTVMRAEPVIAFLAFLSVACMLGAFNWPSKTDERGQSNRDTIAELDAEACQTSGKYWFSEGSNNGKP